MGAKSKRYELGDRGKGHGDHGNSRESLFKMVPLRIFAWVDDFVHFSFKVLRISMRLFEG
jgi:hypothetical protein